MHSIFSSFTVASMGEEVHLIENDGDGNDPAEVAPRPVVRGG